MLAPPRSSGYHHGMPLARRLSVVCAALALAGPAAARGEPAPAPAAPATSPLEQVAEDSSPAADEAALDVILPCGLRVLAARDVSLPVAAVVLAVEVGYEDDPPEYPGLVHALAYHLYQGNRELRPGEAIAAAQDAGGVHLLATGPGQVRFESLVPITSLPDVLFAESQRLRFPTIDRSRWDITLGWAAADAKVATRFRRDHFAQVHGAPGLDHDGRAVSRSLSGMVLGSISAQLAGKFTYNRSTLIVVGPEDPAETIKKVAEKFADLPAAQRQVPARAPAPPRPELSQPAAPPADPGKPPAASGKAALAPLSPDQPLAVIGMPAGRAFSLAPTPKAETGKPGTPPADSGKSAAPPADPGTPPPAEAPAAQMIVRFLAWPVPANNAAAGWAGAICRALNRQKREASEPRNARMICDYEPDPRRGALLIRPVGVDDPLEFVRGRLARLSGSDAPLLSQQVAVVAQATRLRVRTPLGLARQLAASPPLPIDPPPGDTPQARPLDVITGLASLADRPALALSVETALLIGTEVPK
jgi:hypothetical protein